MMGWNNMMGLTGGGVFLGGFIWLLIIGALVVGVVLLLRNSNSSGGARYEPLQREPRQTPNEILATRYAKGEIDKEDYEIRRRELETSSATSR